MDTKEYLFISLMTFHRYNLNLEAAFTETSVQIQSFIWEM